jgi:hypothetical protein
MAKLPSKKKKKLQSAPKRNTPQDYSGTFHWFGKDGRLFSLAGSWAQQLTLNNEERIQSDH